VLLPSLAKTTYLLVGIESATLPPCEPEEPQVNSPLTRFLTLLVVSLSLSVQAAEFPAPVEKDWTVKDYRFRSGEQLPELRIHYQTIGSPSGEPVLVLHGTTQSSTSMLAPAFGGELFGPGQALDANRYYVILPDAIGHGKSSKPSDGLRAGFPRYTYDDLVEASYRLVMEHLGIRRVRLVLGYSMGGMQTWIMAGRYPQFMDVAVPMASLPSEMSGRNWMLRRLIIDSIRKDPEWANGNYTNQPRSAQFASVFYGLATLGGNQGLQRLAPTREKADALVDQRLSAPFPADTNDVLYQWESSRDYNPSDGLERIEATLLAINSADDERNPPELGVLDREIRRVKRGQTYIIPGSENTYGHGTAYFARNWSKQLGDLLQSAPSGSK
jgi:homoserine O-acetyltransferase